MSDSKQVNKCYIEVEVDRFSDEPYDKFYGVSANFKTGGSSSPCDSVDSVVSTIRSNLKNFANDGLILNTSYVKLINSTSINLSVEQLLNKSEGLARFFNQKPFSAKIPLPEEQISEEKELIHQHTVSEDSFNKNVLDPMRNEMYELEKQCRKFGLPERTGFSCWGFNEFKKSCKKYPAAIKLFKTITELHCRFYMAHSSFEGKLSEWNPSKSDQESAYNSKRMLDFLN